MSKSLQDIDFLTGKLIEYNAVEFNTAHPKEIWVIKNVAPKQHKYIFYVYDICSNISFDFEVEPCHVLDLMNFGFVSHSAETDGWFHEEMKIIG